MSVAQGVRFKPLSRPGKPWYRRFNWIGAGTLIVLLVVWELLDHLGVLSFDFIPAPFEILGAVGQLWNEGVLPIALAHTALVAIYGWIAASVIGLALGVTLGLWQPVWRWTAASIEVLRSFPSITFVPLAVLLFGFSLKMELVVVIYAATWQVLINTLEGVRTVDPSLHEIAKTLRMSTLRRIFTIVLPAAASKIIVGLRLALNLALILTVASEVVGNPEGLGYGLVVEQNALQPARMFVYFISVGVLGILLNMILQFIVTVLLPGVTAAADRGSRS